MAENTNPFLRPKALNDLPFKFQILGTDQVLFYNGVTLSRASWQQVLDSISAGIVGIATPSSPAPPQSGFFRYLVHEAGTYTNFGGVVVTPSDLIGNLVTLEVTDGSTVKVLTDLGANQSAYGVEWDITVSNPLMTRIGNTALHQALPIQSKMRRCLLNDDGTVNYYLDPNNSNLKRMERLLTLREQTGK